MNQLRLVRCLPSLVLALLFAQACAETPTTTGELPAQAPPELPAEPPPTNDAGEPLEVAVTAQALTPVPGCIDVVYDGRDYRWCAPFVPWQDARNACISYGLELVSIQDPAENAFVAQLAGGLVPMWIGANDITTENTWVWSNGNVPFLTGSIPGTPVMGRYENFPDWEPVPDGGALDCANIRPGTGGAWFTTHCLEFSTFVCETNDQCPGDPLKIAPGTCGCGVADTDSDTDSVPNCIDGCPGDPAKRDPGIMGCGVADTDSDGDGVPNAIDDAPTDVNVQVIGDCGTATSPQPPGTPCDDAPCPGRFTCDGAGRCGTAVNCPIPNGGGTCRYRRFQESGYWFCSGSAVWSAASANCRSPIAPGQALVKIDSAAENAFVTANLTADAWIGASDTGSETQFRWAKAANNNGERFWTGGATGKPYYARYSNWMSGEPSATQSTDDCAALVATGANRGRWDVRPCDTAGGRPFVCEAPGPDQRITLLDWPESPTINEIYELPPSPTRSYVGCTPEASTPLGTNVPGTGDRDAVVNQARTCYLACQGAGSLAGCQASCAGVASVPPSGSSCPAWTAAETSLCKIVTAAVVGGQRISCFDDLDCGAAPAGQRRCGFYKAETLPSGKSRTERVCGVPEDRCPDPALAEPTRCAEVNVCEVPHRQTLSTLTAPGGDLAPAPFSPTAAFGSEPPDPPVTPYVNQSNPCPTGFLGACNLDENHPWCNYDVNDSAISSNDKSANGAGSGRSGDNNAASEDLISFYFDPQMLLTYDASIGALGLPRANLTAEAGLKAGVDIGNVLVLNMPPFDVIDVLAAVDGTECGLSTSRSRVRILEQDFVPGRDWAESGGPVPANSLRCQELYTQFQDAADRANKALRDAAYLIRLYRSLPAGTGFGNLCTQLAASAPRGFPASAGCGSESPERTIARFVDYYRSSVLGFAASTGVKSVSQIAQEFAGLSATNALQFSNTINLFTFAPEPEELTIFNAQFFIGPIPCNLEVYAALTYGLAVDMSWSLNPGGLINAALFAPGVTTESNVAQVGISGEPRASALLGVFAGAGFDVGPVAAKFGVDAQLTLGTISVPARAMAGLNVGAEPEDTTRTLPTELNLMSSPSPEYLVPPKRYTVSLAYGAGLSARVQDILSGRVNARLKLKFFFFSKSWSKRLFEFDSLIADQEYSLISLEGTQVIAALDGHGWGKVSMPSPFPAILGPNAFGPAPATTVPALTGPVEEFFYDNLCTCITGVTDQKTGLTRECTRADDCCASTPRCFADPAASPAGRNTCVGSCRARGTSCNVPTDCCTAGDKCFNDPTDSLNYGLCSACRVSAQSCTADSDCCSTGTQGCFNPPGGASYRQCLPKSGCLGPCDSNADCTSGLFCTSSGICQLPGNACPPM